MTRLLLQGAQVLTFDALDRRWPVADILVEDGRIAAVGPDLVPPEGPLAVVDARRRLAIPGLINAHLHSPANLMKGLLEGAPLEIFMLYEVPPLAAEADTPEVVRLRTLLGAAEMLRLGITTVHDDAFFVPVPTPETIDALMGAYRDSGMRATVALDQPNVPELEKLPFLADLLPPAERAALDAARPQSSGELLNLYAGFIDRWHGAEGGRLCCSVSCSAPQRVTLDYFQGLEALSRRHDLPFNIHMLETRLQRVLGQERWGHSLIRHVDELGLLTERSVVIHAIWVDRDDIDRLARSGCTVAHNPVCNLKLGSGIMPFRALRDAGVPVCLGTDEAAADDSLDLWGAIKTAGLVHKITDADDRRWPTAAEILACVYAGGARSLRQPDGIGALEPGRAADIVLLDRDHPAFRPLNDPVRQLVYAGAGGAVTDVFVAGRRVVRDGRLTTIDEAALLEELAALLPARRRRHAEVDAVARRLEPYYRAMHEKALGIDVKMSRWAGNLERD
jgi:cytosine/adenosine deaminase-related metal-dependent hydrolase